MKRASSSTAETAFAIVALAVGLSACAPTAKTASFALPAASQATPDFVQHHGEGDPLLIAIRFPVSMTPEAEEIWVQRLVAGFGDGNELNAEFLEVFNSNSALNNTLYHSLELYSALKERLPPSSVVLSPQKLVISGTRLEWEPLLETGTLPALVEISLWAVDNPDRERMMDTPYLTFGDTFTPAIRVAYGDLLGGSDAGLLIETTFRGICQNGVGNVPLMECLNGVDQLGTLSKDQQKRIRQFRIPAQKVRLDISAIKRAEDKEQPSAEIYDADPSTVAGSFGRAFEPLISGVTGFAGQALAAHKEDGEVEHLSGYIAALVGDGTSPDLSVGGNLGWARRLYAAEVAALSQMSASMLATIYDGEFGEAFRIILGKEAALLEARRASARSQNTAMALSIFGAALGGGLAGVSGSSAPITNMQYASTTLMAQQAVEEQKSLDLANSFAGSFFSAYDDQTQARGISIEGVEESFEGNLAELRQRLRQIWLDNRS